jgi:hypothetical protein
VTSAVSFFNQVDEVNILAKWQDSLFLAILKYVTSQVLNLFFKNYLFKFYKF